MSNKKKGSSTAPPTVQPKTYSPQQLVEIDRVRRASEASRRINDILTQLHCHMDPQITFTNGAARSRVLIIAHDPPQSGSSTTPANGHESPSGNQET